MTHNPKCASILHAGSAMASDGWDLCDCESITSFDGKYKFLSNFWLCKIVMEGIVYASVEHAYQASKTTDSAIRKRIATSNNPAQAKRMGRTLELREEWSDADFRLGTMSMLIEQKFNSLTHPELAQKLKDTAPRELIEGNWWGDTYWGVCKGRGENHLGKILMRIREELS